MDEAQSVENDPTDAVAGLPHGRTSFMWPAFLNGAGGFEWYVQADGGGHELDYTTDDYTQFEAVMAWCSYVRTFMERLPLDRMDPAPEIAGTGHALADPGSEYAVYCPAGPSGVTIDLPVGDWSVEYFDPTDGTWDDPRPVGGGRDASLPPSSFDGDAAARITPA